MFEQARVREGGVWSCHGGLGYSSEVVDPSLTNFTRVPQSETAATMLEAMLTPARKLGRFLSDSDLARAQEQHRNRRQGSQSLGFYILQRKRRMVASAISSFLVDESFSIEQAARIAGTVERIKSSIQDNLKISSLLCSSYTGARLARFRAACLGTLCGTWHLMLDAGVCEFLDAGFRDFLLGNSAAMLQAADK